MSILMLHAVVKLLNFARRRPLRLAHGPSPRDEDHIQRNQASLPYLSKDSPPPTNTRQPIEV